ncbi:MAG TPA: tripartite tricarboxylate transporter substrate binding protein [Ramlibacter sp.]|nr:tripartite tricarboxylate transporter substrate binding protein [Ramlibacter sp.]
MHRFIRAAVAALALGALAPSAFAQRVIHLVVPFGPGAVQDTIARTFNAELGQALGASVIVENKPGAGGTIGTAAVAKSPADGTTLIVAAASHTLGGHLYSKLAYDPIKDFTGVAFIGSTGYVIAAPANLGVSTMAEYVKLLKSKPGQYNYASAGNGSATHLGMAYFLAKAGIEMQHVPFKSTGDAVNEVLAGRVQGVTSALIGIVPFKQDARIKLLAYTGAQRSKFMPDLPTVAESGVAGYKFDSWIGVLAPAGLPKAELDKLNAAMNKVLATPEVQERLTRLGVEPATMGAEEFNRLLRADWDNAGVIVKASGAKIE